MTEDRPLVSIVTPVFNCAGYIEDCVKSVLEQDYTRVEHIVQDGGSSDGTVDILKKYDGKIDWASAPDSGQADGLDKALKRCGGDIILVLNADDTLLPHAASWAVKNMEKYPECAVIYGDEFIIDENGRTIGAQYGPEPYDYDKLFCCEIVLPAQAAFIRRTALQKVGLYADATLATCPDYEMWVRIGSLFPMKKAPGFISKYRYHTGSEGSSPEVIDMMVRAKKSVIDRHLRGHLSSERLRKRAYAGVDFWGFTMKLRCSRKLRFLQYALRAPGKLTLKLALKVLYKARGAFGRMARSLEYIGVKVIGYYSEEYTLKAKRIKMKSKFMKEIKKHRISTVSVVGLGKLGMPMIACFAQKGLHVIGTDLDRARVDMVNSGGSPVKETGLREMLAANKKRVRATVDMDTAVNSSDITFVVVPTPSGEDGSFSNDHVLDACQRIGVALIRKKKFHLVVITSTVMPGSMEGPIRGVLEEVSGKKCGQDFGLCYNPEFIALGSVIHDFMNPDFLLIGESDVKSGEVLSAVLRVVCDNEPGVARMNFINAEVTKLAVNTFITTKISYANMLKSMCQRLPGGNVDVVTGALGMDKRIGHRYLKGAMGYGGPCFPRDNVALGYVAERIGAPTSLFRATDNINDIQIQELVDLILSTGPGTDKAAVLGLSYKPNTGVVEESQGIKLVEALLREGISVTAYDPQAIENARKVLGDRVSFASSVEGCVSAAGTIVVVEPWEEFKGINVMDLAADGERKTIIDCWRVLDADSLKGKVNYIPLGLGAGEAVYYKQS